MKHKNIKQSGFTLIELVVVVAIIAVLSGVVLFSVSQYINKGKDSNMAGNMAVLVPAGEIYYNGNGYSYSGFCNNDVVLNAISQMPDNINGTCRSSTNLVGLCCSVAEDEESWAACAREFANDKKAYCVDSRGVKKDIDFLNCNSHITKCQ